MEAVQEATAEVVEVLGLGHRWGRLTVPSYVTVSKEGHCPNIGTVGRGSMTERLRSNGAEIFRGITGVTPNVAEYRIESTERIMDDLNCTSEQKLKGAVWLFRDEAYQWWLTIKEGIQPNREFLNLTQGDKPVVEYESEFLRLSRYARGMVATEYERCVHFEDNFKDDLRVLIAPKRERDFALLVEKAKIVKDVKHAECQNRKTDRARSKKPCAICGRRHQGECWKQIGVCLRCGSLEHCIRDCPRRPDQMQATGMGTVQPPRGF
ncbi:uncharacterized protein LOC128280372 [Gossypium arboreum]|uniref:uncharacterized protein LOC128280372 n=1 Tax=Gossypium arboreum TaxID=29729 RepID=UPI0022F19CE5|nr:uncharacterized protein LOC128280372 [Gossypium arboreum]